MAAKKRPKAKRPPKGDEEYRLKIDAFTPGTMPMARLAEYMAQLAEILGHNASVHFERLEPGSTVLVHRIEREAIPKVRQRAESVRRGDAPRNALVAYKKINGMLRDDNGSAVLLENKKRAAVLRFPGREEKQETYPAVKQLGSIEGQVVRVGGIDETIPVLLESEGEQIAGIYTNRQIARQLGQRLFDSARLHGQGTWTRDADGVWSLKSFRIDTFEWLEDQALGATLEQLRAVPSDWDSEGLQDLEAIRHGTRRHGRS